jgi:hypothetical protein
MNDDNCMEWFAPRAEARMSTILETLPEQWIFEKERD